MAKKHSGSAAPLGLFCFGITTCLIMLGSLYPDYIGKTDTIMAWFGGYVQIIAGFVEIYRENIFLGTVFAGYGCFWVAMSYGAGSQIYHCTFGFLTLGFLTIALRKSYAGIVLFGGVAIALFMLAFAKQSYTLNKGGHWLGFWMGVLAVYCGFGHLIKEEYGYEIPGTTHVPDWFPIPKKGEWGKAKEQLFKKQKKQASFEKEGDLLPSFYSHASEAAIMEENNSNNNSMAINMNTTTSAADNNTTSAAPQMVLTPGPTPAVSPMPGAMMLV